MRFMLRRLYLFLLGFLMMQAPALPGGLPACAQSAAAAPVASPHSSVPASVAPETKPIPDVPTLMREVEANQKHIDEIRKDYRYRALETDQELDGKGKVKKTNTEEREVFYVNGQHIERVIQRDGKDLSPKDQQKEQESVNKAIAKAREVKDGQKKDPNGNAIISVSRLLELGTISTPRRIVMNGRSTIVFDFAGNTRAKSSNMSEGVMKDLTGTVWIDEADHQVTRMEAHFEQNFHIGGGLLVNIQKGTSFTFEQARVNNEVWLPTSIDGNGSARVLLVKAFNGRMHTSYSDYHKYTADVKILPGTTPVAAAPLQNPPQQP